MRTEIVGLMIFLCFVFTGCSDKDKVPHGILPVNNMCSVMWDMIQADQYAAILARDSAHSDARSEHLRLYEQVFRLHNITRENFQKSYNYYLQHPELNQILSDSLTAHGNRLRNEAYAHPSNPPAVTLRPTPAVNPASQQNPLLRGHGFNPPIPGKAVPGRSMPGSQGKPIPGKTVDTTFRSRVPQNRFLHTRRTADSSNPAHLRAVP